jgi:hypothetical protein
MRPNMTLESDARAGLFTCQFMRSHALRLVPRTSATPSWSAQTARLQRVQNALFFTLE